MGLAVVLEDERREKIDGVEDPTNILHRLLPTSDDRNFSCLRYVDWYGDTVFNRQQLPDLVEEVRRIAKRVTDHEEIELLGRIVELALRGQSQPHLYLRFVGD